MTKRRRLTLCLIGGLALADVAGAAYLWTLWQARAEQRMHAPGLAGAGAQLQLPHPARAADSRARRPLP